MNDASNARSLRRREAVSLLNGLAVEVGLKKVPVKALASRVEALLVVTKHYGVTDSGRRRGAAK